MSRILFVLTSHRILGETGKPTGVWLEELAAPYWLLRDRGHSVTLASIAGGEVPIDPGSLGTDADRPAAVTRFLGDAQAMAAVRATAAVGTFAVADFDALFLPGGHGTMWDLPGSAELAALVGQAFDAGRVIAAVCHGPAGLVAARRADGKPVVSGLRLTSFTDEEEAAVGLTDVVPFALETRLRALGASFAGAPKFTAHAVRDGRLITGQNPASSEAVAEAIDQALAPR